MSEPSAEVLSGLFCDVSVFQPEKIACNGYSGPLKLAGPKPCSFVVFNALSMGPLGKEKKKKF